MHFSYNRIHYIGGIIGICFITICLSLGIYFFIKYDSVTRIKFALYKARFDKQYGDDHDERFRNFKASLAEIDRLNELESSNVFGLTEFADWSDSEFIQSMSLKGGVCNAVSGYGHLNLSLGSDTQIPMRYDWRDKGFVSPVINQKGCLGCWAISIIGVMESMRAIKRNEKLTELLSVQELIDCSKHTMGCHGGNMIFALEYLRDNKQAIVPDSQYPLTLYDEGCKVGPFVPGTRVSDFKSMCDVNEEEIARAIANHGPVLAIVHMAPWKYYTGGIIYRACRRGTGDIRHVVQIVGYDKTGPIPYYIVKNSWGKRFGIDGYVKLAMYGDVCGISQHIATLDVIE